MTNNKPSELTTSTISEVAPKELGYYFPAEFALHRATWLSWPHKEASWPGKIHTIYPSYVQFIKELVKGELVRINIVDEEMLNFAKGLLINAVWI